MKIRNWFRKANKATGFSIKCPACKGTDVRMSLDIDYDIVRASWVCAARLACHGCGYGTCMGKELTRTRQFYYMPLNNPKTPE